MRRPLIFLRPVLPLGIILIVLSVAMALYRMPAHAQGAGPTGEEESTGETGKPEGTAPAPEGPYIPNLPQGPGPAETYADLKMQYFAALERIVELEQACQEALDLARGYRSDLDDQRTIAEARKLQAEQALELANTLVGIIKEMKDIINKQHEIILRLTSKKPLSLGLNAGVSLQPREMSGGGFSLQPGITLGVIVF
ncbi:MAG TPA: hypothetical protein GX506_06740 [Firmicutes bacterium]|nr:hypothetical protein [Bacillota bacterium]